MAIWNDYNWDFWEPENDPLPEKVSRYRKISICTTCMNRLYDLKETLPKNIKDNKDYPNLEFVVLDYNSTDGLEEWMKNNMMDHISTGRVVYCRTQEPEYFEMGHSRNIAFKLASGDIVNNVDADNFVNNGFADVLNKMAEIRPKQALFCKGKRGMHGRIGFYKDDFLSLGGYDEDLVGYGFDDHNLVYRAMCLGFKMMWWGGKYCDRIKTPRGEVTANMEHKSWRETEKINQKITFAKIEKKEWIVNRDRHWGKAKIVKNFNIKLDI